MQQAQLGDAVGVHYAVKTAEGKVFDSTANRDPMWFTVGNGFSIPGLEDAVVGMTRGQSKTLAVLPEKAFGCPEPALIKVLDRSRIAERLDPKVGEIFEVREVGGQNAIGRITQISETTVTLDFNHPLAGKGLILDIQLVETARPCFVHHELIQDQGTRLLLHAGG